MRNQHQAPTSAPFELREFQEAPQQFMRKLMTASQHNILGPEELDNGAADIRRDLQRDAAHELVNPADREASPAAAGEPHQLPGTLRIVPNRTSAAATDDRTGAPLNGRPTKTKMAAIVLAERLCHDLLASGVPDDLANQAHTIAWFSDHALTDEWPGLNRPGPMIAEAAARYMVTFMQPTALDFAPTSRLHRSYADVLDDTHATHESSQTAATMRDAREMFSFLHRPRIAWTHPDGINEGLMLDRLHTASRAGVLERDTWTRRKVIEDLQAAAAYLAVHPGSHLEQTATPGIDPTVLPALLGVRVMSHLIPNNGIHVLPKMTPLPDAASSNTGSHASPSGVVTLDGHSYLVGMGSQHRIGGCRNCHTTTRLPNTHLTAASHTHEPAPVVAGSARDGVSA